jgi:hypothetical protein
LKTAGCDVIRAEKRSGTTTQGSGNQINQTTDTTNNFGGGGGGPGLISGSISASTDLVPAPSYVAPAPVYTPVARHYDPAPQSCFHKIYMDDKIVLIDTCTNQQVAVPSGGNECLTEQDATAGSTTTWWT